MAPDKQRSDAQEIGDASEEFVADEAPDDTEAAPSHGFVQP